MLESILSDVARLVDQTSFLLEKQRETRTFCLKGFGDLLTLVRSEIENLASEGDPEKLDKLAEVSKSIEEQSHEFEKTIDEDIAFLEGQLRAFDQIRGYDDPSKIQEVVEILLEGEEIPKTETFKQDVLEEVAASEKSFSLILEDLKSALAEGGVDELIAYLDNLQESEDNADVDGPEVSMEFAPEEHDGGDEQHGASGRDATKEVCCRGSGACGGKCVCNDACACDV